MLKKRLGSDYLSILLIVLMTPSALPKKKENVRKEIKSKTKQNTDQN